MSTTPPRYLSERPFPAYAYLPGRDVHPTGDPKGHSYTGAPEPAAAYLPAAQWRDNADYLFGCDLYNHGYLWEAHEAWEGLWHQAKHDSDQAELLQGLIQCAAASLKVPMQQPAGLSKLSEKGTARLFGIAERGHPHYMGLDLVDFVRAFRAFAASSPADNDARPRIELDLED